MRRAVLAVVAAVWLLSLSVLAVPTIFPGACRANAQSSSTPAPLAGQAPTSPQGSFSLTAQAVALPGGGQTVAGTVVGFTKQLTSTVSLRNDNILAPGSSFQGYFGGVQWFPNASKLLAKTKLRGLAPYVTGSVGVDRIVPATGPSQQHIAFLLGGGMNFTPPSGPTINLFEVRYAKLPGLANSTAIVSSGFTLNF
jgi:hypothetical protein